MNINLICGIFSFKYLVITFLLFFFFGDAINLSAQQDSLKKSISRINWEKRESQHFIIVYRKIDTPLVPHILESAENALIPLMKIFHYKPSEKIIINTFDIYDFGFASTTTVPHNYIRLEIEPLEHGYESVPYNDRFQWIMSHELVHILVNDQSSNTESVMRTLFGKVEPEQSQPLTIPFSLLTNYNRYSPRWYQEAPAVFMETWLSGGYGRILGSFDEMYFRSMVLYNDEFPSAMHLETISAQSSFLLETLYYLYGARFISYLTIKYGSDKLLNWFITKPGEFYKSFQGKFKDTFHTDFKNEWENFIAFEKEFQNANIAGLNKSEVTPLEKLTNEPLGWISEPHVDKFGGNVFFSYHHPNHLAGIARLNLENHSLKELETLPTPSILQVSSTAYDKNLNLFFYTTNNNQLYRDIWVLDAATKENKLLFSNCRIGDLTVAPTTHDLWGILHANGKVSLTYSPYPYKEMIPVIGFNIGDEIFDLAVSPSGKFLSAVLKRSNGSQSIIVANAEDLKHNKPFNFETIYSLGSPESPSWSPNENFIYWSSYTNGVSNIYRFNLQDKKIQAMSNTLSGLFKPVYLNKDSLFAFEFTPEGFLPVIIPNRPAQKLYAIKYLGEELLKKNPKLQDLTLMPANRLNIKLGKINDYNSITNLSINTFIPVISGFQNRRVLGFYTHISDPLMINDLTMEFGLSPYFFQNKIVKRQFKQGISKLEYHFKGKYTYKKILQLSINYNAPDFYDLFNERKRGMTGTNITLEHTHYWIYDNPLKIKQTSSITYYRGIESINDNLIPVSEPDFYVAQTNFNSKNLRRSIGSTDFENGNEFNVTFMLFGANPKHPQLAGQFYTEWDNFSTYLIPHNIFHLKIAAGYHNKNDNLMQSSFFFGGFGNRRVEDTEVDQFRNVFRFPGIPIYSLAADRFFKLMFETALPPLRFSNISIGPHFVDHIDLSLYSQNLLIESEQGTAYIDAGAQLNIVFKHWYNLESTFSAGIAKAWYGSGNSKEWFLSFKLLKNLF
ncbi:MAG: hypothetical protein WAM24_19180 [Ignavibacteriaceae bacterium]